MKYTADTSFIIGLFVNEPRNAQAKEWFAWLKENKEKIYIPTQVIVEVVYVLEKIYKLPRPKVVEYVDAILGTFIFIVDKCEMFYDVMEAYEKKTAVSFGDLVIAEETRRQGIRKILTFDKHFKRLGLDIVGGEPPDREPGGKK